MPYADDNRIQLGINTSTSGVNEIIAAPGVGRFIAIDFLMLNPNGGAQTLIMKRATTEIFRLVLDDNQPPTLENNIQDPKGILTCGDNEAFNLDLSAATQVTGFCKYRIV